ncbi:hypothetical protein [Blastococcus xanthinilyticus]|uniref:Uncharacterized protein n=1 Tax=Blastococcus xanthinilyticus TaxID=1564164 RepID=A0A5S5CVK7_9ACTN|nr:hypothetical protein [Blastococcus xanthinilyticus]TYP86582.1 hypothetical protein BD833_109187 [Blastococcus xanthinilyticus]
MTVAHDHHPPVRRAGPFRSSALLDRILLAAAAWSALHLAFALRWLLDPGSRPRFDDDGRFGLVALLPGAVTTWTVLGLAATGLVLAIAARRRRGIPGLPLVMAVEAVLLGAVSADLGVLSLLGYLCAIVGPAAFVAVLVVGSLRDRRARLALLGVGAVLVAGVVSGLLRWEALSRLGSELAGGFAANALVPAHLGLVLSGAVLWGAAAVLLRRSVAGRCAACGRPAARWTEPANALRWGRIATWTAVAGPLPYAFLRATWLTPWPLGLPGGAELGTATRLFGLGLGLAALGGAVLTVGLIRPWGEVWPGWVPGLRGRPVPVRVPVVAGGLVAAVLLAASPGVVLAGFEGLTAGDGMQAALLLIFPTLPWGLALAAAVTAYAYRRRGACSTCGQGEPALSVRP